MSRLMVQRSKRDAPFHPRIWIRNTGYAKHHVCVRFYREDVEIGTGTMAEYGTIEKAIDYYFSELKRTGHRQV